ncbi:MAG: tetraacyldisaccharide 4'-kinase [Pseudomonadota bacterium]
MIRAPGFWRAQTPTVLATLLRPIGMVVGAVTAARLKTPPRVRPGVPVVCLGNPTVGGAGKTPLAIALAKALLARGRAPVFLTRGYGGRHPGPVRVAGQTAADVGDEPLLLSAIAPTIVAKDRAAGALVAATLGDIIIMDDGFQNPAVAKDFACLVIDGGAGLGNGLCVPAGPLRAPFAAQHPFADAILITRGDEAHRAPLPAANCPTFEVPVTAAATPSLDGARVVAFAGIGRPEKFFASARALGATLVATHSFADHAPYGEDVARALVEEAAGAGARLLTTEKDLCRIGRGSPWCARLAEQAAVIRLSAALPAAFVDRVAGLIRV